MDVLGIQNHFYLTACFLKLLTYLPFSFRGGAVFDVDRKNVGQGLMKVFFQGIAFKMMLNNAENLKESRKKSCSIPT